MSDTSPASKLVIYLVLMGMLSHIVMLSQSVVEIRATFRRCRPEMSIVSMQVSLIMLKSRFVKDIFFILRVNSL